MSDDATYTIGELAERAGVTPRTIRYYTAEGLLPRPDTHGQYARYGAEHVLRLQLIARLKESYLPLHAIRARLAGLGLAELRALLEAEAGAPDAPPSSAAEYLAGIMLQPAPAAQLAESAAAYQLAPTAELPTVVLPPALPPAPASMASPPAPAAAAPVSPAPAAPGMRGLLGRLIPERREHGPAGATPAQPGEAWRRITLAPGVELHIHEPIAASARSQIERLIALARELFAREVRGDQS